jgi:hypothetical protein
MDTLVPANSFRISQRLSTIEIYWCSLTKKGYTYNRLSHRRTRYWATAHYTVLHFASGHYYGLRPTATWEKNRFFVQDPDFFQDPRQKIKFKK